MNSNGYQESQGSGSRIAGFAQLVGEALTAHLVRLDETIGRWQARARDRRMLGRLDERMLSDIGLSRYDVEGEARKPFWRG
jgi:uncharacterized protein YjiS (DUF1127 family)